MAQIILSRLSIELSKRIGDQVTDYRADGETVKAYKREAAINEAVFSIYEAKQGSAAEAEFLKQFPLYRSEKVHLIVNSEPYSLGIEKAADVKRVIDCFVNAWEPEVDNKQAGRLNEQTYYNALTERTSHYKPTLERPKFYERDKVVEIHVSQYKDQVTIANGTIKLIVLLRPVYTVFESTGPDILIPEDWFPEVLKESYNNLTGSNQN